MLNTTTASRNPAQENGAGRMSALKAMPWKRFNREAVTRSTLFSVLSITSKQRSANLFGSSAEFPYKKAS